MAERGGICEAPPSIVGGSDQVVDIQCDPCNFEGRVAEGVGFCTVCKEYLCSDCLRSHKKSKSSRGHKLLEGSDLPRSRRQAGSHDTGVMCAIHQQVIVKFCVSHDVPLCSICRDIEHRKCEGVTDINQISQNEGGSEQTKAYLERVQSLIDNCKDIVTKQKGYDQKMHQSKQACYEEVKTFRQKIDLFLDQLEKEIRQEIDSQVDELARHLSQSSLTIENALKALQLAANSIETAQHFGKDHTFIAMKRNNPSVINIEHVLNDIQKELREVEMTFEPDTRLTDLLTSCAKFGKVSVAKMYVAEHNPVTCCTSTIPGSLKSMKLVKTGQYKISDKGDNSQCFITGSVTLPSDVTLICDFSNQNVKLLDGKYNIVSSLKITNCPWDVAAISDSEAAVTVPHNETIQIVKIEGRQIKVQECRSVKTDRKCWGLAYHRNNLYVSCHDHPGNSEVIILNTQGQLVSRIPGTDNFQRPNYVAVDHTGRMYISDSDTNTLTCMTVSGQTVYTRTQTDTGLNIPHGLLVDNEQNVYIVGAASNNLQIINKDGHLYTSLVKTGEGLSTSYSISYRAWDRTLLVGTFGRDYIQCYRFV